jgi:ferredoxin, 2Fe-2S
MRGSVLVVVDREGRRHELPAESGRTVMELLRENDLPVAAICGGCMSCATCHVYVHVDWRERLMPPDAGEVVLLEDSAHYLPDQSRLSCQIPFVAELSGLTVSLAPED